MVDTMVNLISLSRQFEMQIKMMQTAETNAQRADQLPVAERLILVLGRDQRSVPSGLPHRPGCPADPTRRHRQQSGQREYQRLQAGPGGIRRSALPDLRQPGAQSSQQTQIPTGLQLGTGARPVAVARIFTQGNVQKTDNSLDIAIQGNGFFQVLLPDGMTAYTGTVRSRRITRANRDLRRVSSPRRSPFLPTPSPFRRAGWYGDRHPGRLDCDHQIGSIQLATFINPGGLQSLGQNLFLETAASPPRPTPREPTSGNRQPGATSKLRMSPWPRNW